MTGRERILLALSRRQADRIPKLELCFWAETVERWRQEGLPAGVEPADYFGLDGITIFSYDGSLGLPEKTLSETGTERVFTDSNGVTYKELKGQTNTECPQDYLIKSQDDWEEHRSLLTPTLDRLKPEEQAKYDAAKAKDEFTVLSPIDPCWYALRLMGEEEFLMNTVLEPEYTERVISDYLDFNLAMLEQMISSGYQMDAVWFFSDLCYKNGMLFSPDFYRKRLMPYHKRMFDCCHANNLKVIYHCDGKVDRLLPLLVESGIDCIQPMEARAGNDVREYKKLYGDRIAFMGNISADVMGTTRDAIETEMRDKILTAKQGGGYVYHSDHSIPPSVSFENYCAVMEMVDKYGKY